MTIKELREAYEAAKLEVENIEYATNDYYEALKKLGDIKHNLREIHREIKETIGDNDGLITSDDIKNIIP